jgi:uncharacterized protein involved in type VI secretion and phage assembly
MLEEDSLYNTYGGVYEGQVVDNVDPLKLGRVRFMIPGLVEPMSPWTLPLASPGAGSDARGLWCIPSIGSNVAVLFKEGDLDAPRYLTGPWGAPDDTPETPTFARNLSAADAVKVTGLQTKDWEIVLDDRPGLERLTIANRTFPQNSITIDGLSQAVEIRGTVAVQIRSTGIINIDALQVVINGRPVLPSSKPI